MLPAERATLWCARALACTIAGRDPVAHRHSLESALAVADAHDLRGSAAFASTELGWIDLARGNPAEAYAWFERARRSDHPMPLTLWRRNRQGLALAATLVGDGALANTIADDVVDLVDVGDAPGARLSARSFRCRVWLLQRRFPDVRQWIDALPNAVVEDLGVFLESASITRMRALLALSGPERIPALIDAACAYELNARELSMGGLADAAVVCQALGMLALGRRAEAAVVVEPALRRAAERGDVLAVAEFGRELTRLFRACKRRGVDPAFLDAVARLVKRIDTLWPDPMSLTSQELAVVRELATGATFDEIATRLFMNPASARGHATRAYRKLRVVDGREAVDTARQLGIIPPASGLASDAPYGARWERPGAS